MRHATPISISQANSQWDERNAMLDRIFGFVLDLVEGKGKGDETGED